MSSTPACSDSVIHADPNGEHRHYCPGEVPGTKATDDKENSPPLVIIGKHEVVPRCGRRCQKAYSPALESLYRHVGAAGHALG